jgi:hypothetical protein
LQDTEELLFLDAPSETDKTFMLNFLLEKLPAQIITPLAVASSKIASTLLQNAKQYILLSNYLWNFRLPNAQFVV